MSLAFTLHTAPAVPLEADVLSPTRLAGLGATDVARMPVVYGNQRAELGDFFTISGAPDDTIHLTGDLSRIKFIGAAMAGGRLFVHGTAGMHLGATMSGGVIEVEGDAGDWVGPEMTGGRIIVRGNAGHLVGSAVRGSTSGMQGGEILVFGHAGNEIGSGMRRGLVAIGGDCGDFAGVNMLAGTIVVFGQAGWRPGAGLKRGTIVAMKPVELLPTFTFACTYHPVFLRLYLRRLRLLGLPVTEAQLTGLYQRWSGDAIELNRGEILLHQA
ncbi:MAG: formylmethanofuran dehydrogenase subunit C [Gemmatimonadota bacterium]|nr:formylmethanofuran dehydrogenase subunit C [Gemmatimonadota bacterium]MDH5284366.1 formylmethanofuran dehydrogenase subunit C [Gemmatimonadota bacterium]